ncbi:MAG: apolipoprotein N-acyltransferase [Arcanobacterium sp.]|nr:apolipoprotein N-acyltransferase [Arcanobacterium sp.]
MPRVRIVSGPFAFLLHLLLAGLAGVSLWAAGAPRSWWPAALLGVALLWLVVRRLTAPRAFLWGFVGGFVFFYLHFDWALAATGLVAARVVLAGIEATFIGFVAVLWAGIWRSRLRHHSSIVALGAVVASGVAWAGVEVLRSAVPFGGLPWGLLGYLLVNSPLVHLAPWGSTELVGAVGVMCAVSGVIACENVLTVHLFRAVRAAVVCCALLVAPLAVGLLPPATGQVKVAIVQGNTPELGTVSDAMWATITTANHVEAAQEVVRAHPDLVVLPESTSDYDYRVEQYPHDLIMNLAHKAGVPLLLGTQRYFHKQGSDVRTNDYVVQYPNDQLPTAAHTYSKQHPVPFGEYVPLRGFFEKLTSKIDEISIDMVPGERPAQLSVQLPQRTLTVAVPICFEVAYSSIVSQGVTGSELLVVPTSNVTFGRSSEAFQQFAITQFRAIENARTAIQVSTMGTSGVVAPDGAIKYRTGLFERDARVVSVPLFAHTTLAARTYHIRPYYVLAGLLIATTWAVIGLCRKQ